MSLRNLFDHRAEVWLPSESRTHGAVVQTRLPVEQPDTQPHLNCAIVPPKLDVQNIGPGETTRSGPGGRVEFYLDRTMDVVERDVLALVEGPQSPSHWFVISVSRPRGHHVEVGAEPWVGTIPDDGYPVPGPRSNVSPTPPVAGDALVFDGALWVPTQIGEAFGNITYPQLPLGSGEWDPGEGEVITFPRLLAFTNDDGAWRPQISMHSDQIGGLFIYDGGGSVTRGYSGPSDPSIATNIRIWRGNGSLRIQRNIIPTYDIDDNFAQWSLEDPLQSGIDVAYESEGFFVQGFSVGDAEKTQLFRSRVSGAQKRNISFVPLVIGLPGVEIDTSLTVAGAVPGTCQLAILKATGTAVLDPITARLWTVSSGADWAFGAPNYWSAHEHVSDDTTPPGASVRGRWSVHAENIDGSRHGMGLWVGAAAGPALALTLGSDLSALFAGAVTVTGALTATLTGNASTASVAPAGTLTGTELAAGVVTSSLTTIGTLVGGAVPASLVTAGTLGNGAYTVNYTATEPVSQVALKVTPTFTATAANVTTTQRALQFIMELTSAAAKGFTGTIFGVDGQVKLTGNAEGPAGTNTYVGMNAQVRNEGTGTLAKGIALKAAQAVNSGGGVFQNAAGVGISPQTVGSVSNVGLLFGLESAVSTFPAGNWALYSYDTNPSLFSGILQVASSVTTSPRGIMSSQHNDGNDGARLHLRKSRGTLAVPTIIGSGDNLGRVVASGYDGAAFLEMGSMIFGTQGTVALNRVPTNWQIHVATDASPSVLTERLRVTPSGDLYHVGSLARFGEGHGTATPLAATLAAPSAAGTNVAGADRIIQPGNGVGSGAGGTFRVQTAVASTPIATRPAHDQTGLSVMSASAVASRSWNHTVGDGSSRLLLVWVMIRNTTSQTVATVDFGGVALTLIDSQTNGVNVRVELWQLVAPAIGVGVVTVTLAAAATARFVGGSSSFFYVDPATPTGTTAKATGNNQNATVAITTAASDLVVDVFVKQNLTETPAATGTVLGIANTVNAGGNTDVTGGAQTKDGTGGSVTMNWTWTTTNRQWAILAVPLKFHAAGTPNTFADRLTVSGAGAISLVGPTVGAYGVTPVARPAGWAITNGTVDKILNADATSLDEIADCLYSILVDLTAQGWAQGVT